MAGIKWQEWEFFSGGIFLIGGNVEFLPPEVKPNSRHDTHINIIN